MSPDHHHYRAVWQYTPHPDIPKHTPVLSRNGVHRGHSLGGGQVCPAKGCIATYGRLWQLAVRWETGDTTIICPAGWVLVEDPFPHVRIIAGGEITARYVNPRDPKPDQHPLLKAHRQLPWKSAGWAPSSLIANHTRPTPEQDDPVTLF